MRLGFTGTQIGMNAAQQNQLRNCIANFRLRRQSEIIEFHHGDCIGADAQAHDISVEFGCVTHIHPPENGYKRAYKQGYVTYSKKPYLDRNHDIVDSADVLIAAPKSSVEELRSGTWATIRYARKCGKPIIFLIAF